MISWITEHWTEILIYWGLCYAIILNWYHKQDDLPPMKKREALGIALIAWLLPYIFLGVLIGKFIAAGKGSDDT